VAALLAVALLAAQEPASQPEVTFESTELAPGLYMVEGVGGFGGGNVGLLTGEDGVALVDDSFPPLTESLLAAVAEVAKAPVGFVINTHVHGDHLGGNEILGERGATIVAHDNVRTRLVASGILMGGEPLPASPGALPVLTFADAVTFHLNGQEAYVFHVENAHTDGDAVIHFRQADVIHAGDVMFHQVFPYIDLDSGGSVDGYIAAQERILEIAGPATRIIPGHGPLATTRDLEASIAMLKDARARIQALINAGSSVEEAVAARPLADYEELSSFITTERMIRQVYRGLSGE
jgi:glyoxylase-like metal-dependent hydrolase (beta-lactamase superfamily II)